MAYDSHFRVLAAGFLVFFTGLVPIPFIQKAQAAETPVSQSPSTGEPASSPYKLPVINVTADKHITEVQKTPMAITVITAQELEDAGIQSIQDVLRRVPNLSVHPTFGGNTNMSFRGVSTTAGNAINPLVIYVDGVPVDTVLNLDANLMDIERIEILRGAQGVIYGKNSLGGIINIISKKPGNTVTGKLQVGFGTDETYNFGGTVSGPIIEDRLFYSLSAQHGYTGGWMKNDNTHKSNAERTDRVKGRILLTPTDRAEFSFHVDYTQKDVDFSPYVAGNSVSMKSPAHGSDYTRSQILNTALQATLRFEPLIFESISTFRFEEANYRLNMNPLVAAMGNAGRDVERKEFSQEIRLRSPDDKEGLAWLGGAFFSYGDTQFHKMFAEYQPISVPYVGTFNMYVDQPYREYMTEFAPFAQIEIPITDAFKIIGGLRWHYTKKDASINYEPNQDMQTLAPMLGMSATPVHASVGDEWNELLPRLTLNYSLTKDHMIYAGISRSFIPGGFNYASTTGMNAEFDSQTAWNYEIGAKTSWLDNRLTANLALFYSDYEDLQVMQYDAASASYLSDNAGSAKSYGAELDLTALITKGLTAELGFGYTHARLKDYEVVGSTGTTRYDDHYVPFTPEYTADFALQYRHDSGIFVRGEVHHFGKLYWEVDNVASRKPVTTVDARVGYETDSFGAYLYGTNILGERYFVNYSGVSNFGMVAPPQEFGVQLSYKF
ncbi:MAG: TonB-dependent receptor [Desulfovibrio sp.]|jgi:iron complex outermembrane receptor protein|nr:TonB-dependent receptor [Desulfovibrio sp.]